MARIVIFTMGELPEMEVYTDQLPVEIIFSQREFPQEDDLNDPDGIFVAPQRIMNEELTTCKVNLDARIVHSTFQRRDRNEEQEKLSDIDEQIEALKEKKRAIVLKLGNRPDDQIPE